MRNRETEWGGKENYMNPEEFTPYIMELAEKNAREMIKAGETTRKFQFGVEEGGHLWLSRDPHKVIPNRKIQVDEKDFYLALFKEREVDNTD